MRLVPVPSYYFINLHSCRVPFLEATFSLSRCCVQEDCGWGDEVANTLARMDFERINYELIEHVLRFIVEGGSKDRPLPKEGSILIFLPGILCFISLEMYYGSTFAVIGCHIVTTQTHKTHTQTCRQRVTNTRRPQHTKRTH